MRYVGVFENVPNVIWHIFAPVNVVQSSCAGVREARKNAMRWSLGKTCASHVAYASVLVQAVQFSCPVHCGWGAWLGLEQVFKNKVLVGWSIGSRGCCAQSSDSSSGSHHARYSKEAYACST